MKYVCFKTGCIYSGDGYVYTHSGRVTGAVKMTVRNTNFLQECLDENDVIDDVMLSYNYDKSTCYLTKAESVKNPSIYYAPNVISRSK